MPLLGNFFIHSSNSNTMFNLIYFYESKIIPDDGGFTAFRRICSD